MTERIRIDGIKLSNELVAINFRNLPDTKDSISRFCQILAQNQINIFFLSTTCVGESHQISCCVAAEDRSLVRDLIDSELGRASNTEFISEVGLLTLFPHQFSLIILGLVLHVFGKACLPLYGLVSSLSVLTCITDYAQLHRAVIALQEYLDVPPDQISLKPDIHVRQKESMR